jgi:hypothetical protein
MASPVSLSPLLQAIEKALSALKGTDLERNASIQKLKNEYDEYIDCCCHETHYIVSKEDLKKSKAE